MTGLYTLLFFFLLYSMNMILKYLRIHNVHYAYYDRHCYMSDRQKLYHPERYEATYYFLQEKYQIIAN